MAKRGFLCLVEIFDNSTGRADKTIFAITNTEAFERSCSEMFQQTLPCLIRVEIPTRAFGDNGVGQLRNISDECFGLGFEQLASSVGQQTLSGR